MRRWIGWAVVGLALAVMVAAYLTDPKERTGRAARPQGPRQEAASGDSVRRLPSETF